ncbi:hypothetical protein Tsubulata_036160 [Turnera subulata]|uniref:Protein TIC 20 n=1 Tax=Turnera subulata TaxID=218843 RepID=A0A9Q0J243_9ROSI|nr:hypothetical protein Tsubulata_036160 [Turnera subulata]
MASSISLLLRFSPLPTPKTLTKPYPPPLSSSTTTRLPLHRNITTIACMSQKPAAPAAADRLLSAVAYTFPFLNSLQYGGFLLEAYPSLALHLQPVIPLYRWVPMVSFVAFLALYFGVVRNPGGGGGGFSEYVRFNAMQALAMDVLVMLFGRISKNPGRRTGLGLGFDLLFPGRGQNLLLYWAQNLVSMWAENVVFLVGCYCFFYALVSCALGKTPRFQFIGDAAGGVDGAIITLHNRCMTTIWPGILGGAGQPQLVNGGLELRSGEEIIMEAPEGWSGRLWARSGCTFDSSGQGTCTTGDCGGKLRCGGAGGTPPATLAEFTLGTPLHYYDVSLVDGFNLPVSIKPYGSGSKGCKAARCAVDLNRSCPDGLQVKRKGSVVACKSACLAFNEPEYCCTGAYSSPTTCKPTNYSLVFKTACPSAYTYAFDDPSSLFTCNGGTNYLVTFC